MLSNDQIRERIALCKENEKHLNNQLASCDKTIKEAKKRKQKLVKQVSKNMLYRNRLIEKIIP